jgi:hypothetical protein
VATGPSKGEIYECRLARLLHHEGSFVRRAVDLQLHFGEPFTVTDVDVLAVQFSPSLERHVLVAECKTTEALNSPSAADRLMWGTGVRRLVPGADRHMLATVKQASPRIRGLAARLGAEVLDERDISRREALLGLSPTDLSGPHDPSLLVGQDEVFRTLKKDDELKRVWAFVRSEFWFSDEVYGLKRAFGALRLLERRWHPDLPDNARRVVRWLAQECVAAVIVSMVRMAGDCYRQPPTVFDRVLRERLAEGIVPFAVMQDISKDVDRYVMAVLQRAGVDPGAQLDRLGALDPRPPAYVESLAEVLERLALSPRATSQLARLFDERLGTQRGSPVPASAPTIPEADRAGALLETIATFLRGQIKVPDAFLGALTAEAHPKPVAASAPVLAVADESAERARGEISPEAGHERALTVEASETSLAETPGDGDGRPRRALLLGLRNRADTELAVIGAAGQSHELGELVADSGVSLAPGATGHVTLPVEQPVEADKLDTEVTLHVAVRFRDPERGGGSELLEVKMRGALNTDRWTLEP